MRILLVDDDKIFTDLMSSKLCELGFDDLTIAHSAEEAINLVDEQRLPFDCYLLDIMLGKIDGIELCERLRSRTDCRIAPIIMITASSQAHLMDKAFASGATDFMRKPLNHTEMIGRINTAMLLVESTKKEKRGRNVLRTLISYASDFDLIDLAEPVCFSDVNGMINHYQLENKLLKMQDGIYSMNLFRIQIHNFEKLNKQTERSAVMQQLHAISATISETVRAQRFLFSYIGRGRFVCCIIGRHILVPQLFQSRLRERVREALMDLPAFDNMQVRLVVSALSQRRILSRKAAMSLLSKELKAAESSTSDVLPEVDKIEDRIFTRIREEEHKLFGEG